MFGVDGRKNYSVVERCSREGFVVRDYGKQCIYVLDSIIVIVLYWIKGVREWSQFVQNRVNEILRLITREIWNYCLGVENFVDFGLRGVTVVIIKLSELWW